jgi:hypothetical protein
MSNTIHPLTLTYKRNLLSGDGAVHLAYLLLCLPALVMSFIMSTDGTLNSVHLFRFSVPISMPCLFKYFTGLNCPACGMTRSFIYMSHLNLRAAFSMNRAGPLLYALCIFEVPYRLILLVRGHVPLQKVFTVFETALFGAFLAVDLLFFLWQFIRLL